MHIISNNKYVSAITVVKIAVETALFFCSYSAQKRWIFKAGADA